MAFNETHPLIAREEELDTTKHRPSSLQGECPKNGDLSEFHLRSIRAISEAIFSEDEVPVDSARLDWLIHEYQDFMSRAPSKQRLLFTLATMGLAVIGPLFVFRLQSYASLSLALRIQALRKLETRPAGKILIPLRAILCLIYYEHPEAAAQLELHQRPEKLIKVGRR